MRATPTEPVPSPASRLLQLKKDYVAGYVASLNGAWSRKDLQTIIKVAGKIPEVALQEDQEAAALV